MDINKESIRYIRDIKEFNLIFNNLKDHQIVFLLDFDGTLAPIVPIPSEAHMSQNMRQVMINLIKNFPVYIISGREISDLKSRVNLEGIGYAGSHGFEVEINSIVTRVFTDTIYLNKLDQFFNELKDKLSNTPGCILEHNRFSLSVHYRCCNDLDTKNIKDFVFDRIKDLNYEKFLKLTFGKMVLEVRLNYNWNKGKAVEFILNEYKKKYIQENTEKLDKNMEIIPIYIGDDITDEDAFNTVNSNNGISILVASKNDPKVLNSNSNANYFIKNTEAVCKLLNHFIIENGSNSR